jgi:ubiquinone/menaquinone biosynthesis C-methylase UbiE
MKPRMPAYDDVAEAYSHTLDPDGAGLVAPVLSGLIGEVAGQDVLSLVCGQGQDARLLARLGATVTGIDISEEMLRHARRYEAAEPRGIAYVQGDAEDIAAFAGTTFDGVVCHMALDAGGVPGLLYARARRCEGRAPKS